MSWEIALMLGSLGITFYMIYVAFNLRKELWYFRWFFYFLSLFTILLNLILMGKIATAAGQTDIADLCYFLIVPWIFIIMVIFLVVLANMFINRMKAIKSKKEEKLIEFEV
jgi:hypothetical protein